MAVDLKFNWIKETGDGVDVCASMYRLTFVMRPQADIDADIAAARGDPETLSLIRTYVLIWTPINYRFAFHMDGSFDPAAARIVVVQMLQTYVFSHVALGFPLTLPDGTVLPGRPTS